MSTRSNDDSTNPADSSRLRVVVRGAVQGVGFRPFLYRLATELQLAGWVNNSAQGVFVEVEGARPLLEQFLLRVETEKPPRSFIQSLEPSWLDAVGYAGFEIRESEASGGKTALVMPDIATCPDCLREIFDPANRRHRYPFTNCTNCGPRFSIIEALPYDRPNTSMRRFAMCPQCQAEYDDPRDRRFHAQPNACPVCGPHLELWDGNGHLRAGGEQGNSLNGLATNERLARLREGNDQALQAAVRAIQDGRIVAVKGLGGFHLLVDAANDEAVCELRRRKQREEKPFALMFPLLEAVARHCEVSALEQRLLQSPEAPIVLLQRKPLSLAAAVAPANPHLGVMLPYTPLHHLLLAELGIPVVATSGNLSDEPICTEEREACARLRGIADLFLVHNRPIVRHVDDSIVRVMLGRELVLRRARGYAPLPVGCGAQTEARRAELKLANSAHKPGQVPLNRPAGTFSPSGGEGRDEGARFREGAGEGTGKEARPAESVLAVGAHLKNSVALSVGGQVFISQHIGDLETEQSYEAFRRVIADLQRLYEARPAVVAVDLHPDYLSTKYAQETGLPVVGVQHHLAHVWSCLAENELEPPVLGVSWDGTGYGLDGTIWGGEFFRVTAPSAERVAHVRRFRLPGGDQAVKEPRRVGLGLMFEMLGEAAFAPNSSASLGAFSVGELAVIKTALGRGVNAPWTSSMGRLYDAVASLVGLRQKLRFEGQAAMELEFALAGVRIEESYPFEIVAAGEGDAHAAVIVDWAPVIRALLEEVAHGVAVPVLSARFHNTLVEVIVAVARRFGETRIVLTGGCFQNRYLTERAVHRLRAEGFQPYWHQRVPPNDGGIALGQIVAALHRNG